MNHSLKNIRLLSMAVALFVAATTSMPVAAQQCELDVRLSTPSSRFAIESDGTARDSWSQRQWMRCPLGWSLDARSTTNTIDDVCVEPQIAELAMEEALALVATINSDAGLAGADEWRVANITELQSITERACMQPAINLSVFPNRFFRSAIAANIGANGYPLSYEFAEQGSLTAVSGGENGEINSVTGDVWLVRY